MAAAGECPNTGLKKILSKAKCATGRLGKRRAFHFGNRLLRHSAHNEKTLLAVRLAAVAPFGNALRFLWLGFRILHTQRWALQAAAPA